LKTKSLLIIGLLLINGASSYASTALQAVSLAQATEAASQNTGKVAHYSLSATKRAALYTRYIARIGVRKKSSAPKPHVQPLLPVVNQKGVHQKHKIIADEVLRSLPLKCRDTLKNFYVRYDNPKQRGLAGKTTLIISGNVPDDEFRALMIHELGHVFDLNPSTNCLAGTANSGISHFRDGNDLFYQNDPSIQFYQISWINEKTKKSRSKMDDFVTGYAAWNAFEDFSESLAYFTLQNDAFLERAKTNPVIAAKYNWFRTHMFTNGEHLATGTHTWDGNVPWDATKLGYTWEGFKRY